MNRVLSFFGYAFASILVAALVYIYAFRSTILQLEQTGSIQLEQAADRLLGQLTPFQQLPSLLMRHPRVSGLFTGQTNLEETNNFLANTALTVGADALFVLDRNGRIVASSDFEKRPDGREKSFEHANFVDQALSGSLGFGRGFDSIKRKRKLYFARGILLGKNSPQAAIVVQVDVEQLEFEWEGDNSVLVFTDESNVVFVTNRIELRLNRFGVDNLHAEDKKLFRGVELPGFPHRQKYGFLTKEHWSIKRNKALPSRVVLLSEFMPRINMNARIFLDARSAYDTARIYGLFTLALIALIGVGVLALGQRRRRLAERLIVEAAANSKLEARVEERTQQLRSAQNQLVQAGKLTALGQMSAGISHELNQPLAAIRNFAQNGVKLIERNRMDEASENLSRISSQVDRMDRIIRNLRGFARKEQEVIEPVDLTSVFKEAKKLVEMRLKSEGISLVEKGLNGQKMVLGGPVRLQQVIVNLITNAADAVADQANKQIRISAIEKGKTIGFSVSDNGPGLSNPDRVFEPFYTTKDIGSSKGLGLGLSISYGIIGSFGGELSCRNLPEGGAEFHFSLQQTETKL